MHEARAAVTGRDRGDRARVGPALLMAREVFEERGLRGLADEASKALETRPAAVGRQGLAGRARAQS